VNKHFKSLLIAFAGAAITILPQWAASVDIGGLWAPAVTGAAAWLVNAIKIWVENHRDDED
jgi:hypothetical protein